MLTQLEILAIWITPPWLNSFFRKAKDIFEEMSSVSRFWAFLYNSKKNRLAYFNKNEKPVNMSPATNEK